MSHDFAAQQAETRAIFDDLADNNALPDTADVDYFFLPSDAQTDWRPLAEALTLEGYDVEWIDDSDSPEDIPEGEPAAYMVATLSDQPLSAGSIWVGEEQATRIALPHGFTPDGWGFDA